MTLAADSIIQIPSRVSREHFPQVPLTTSSNTSALGCETFQRELQAVLASFSKNDVIVYFDIKIMSTSFEKHLSLVQKVLNTLAEHGIEIKTSKSQWFTQSV